MGGGAGGVEMALAMRSAVDKHRARHSFAHSPTICRFSPLAMSQDPTTFPELLSRCAEQNTPLPPSLQSGALAGAGGDATFAIVTRGEILGTHNARARRLLVQALKDRAIRVVEGAGVREVTPQAVVLEDGRTVPADEVVWCTQAAPQGWLAGAAQTRALRATLRDCAVQNERRSVCTNGCQLLSQTASFNSKDTFLSSVPCPHRHRPGHGRRVRPGRPYPRVHQPPVRVRGG